MRQPPLELKLERLVIGGSWISHQESTSNVGVRWKYLRRLYEPPSSSANVGNGNCLLSTQSLFQCCIPLQRVGQLELRIKCRQSSLIRGVGWCDRGRRRRCGI